MKNLSKFCGIFYYNKNKGEYVRLRYSLFFLIVLIVSLSFYSFTDQRDCKIEYFNLRDDIMLYNYIDDLFCYEDTVENNFNEQNLILFIEDLNLKFPHIVLAQARLETGNYESEVFIKNNNLFGMKEARVRCHTSKGTRLGHAYYDSWEESVLDYALYQSAYFYKIKSERQYFKQLEKMNYAEADNYTNTLMYIIERDTLKDKFLD